MMRNWGEVSGVATELTTLGDIHRASTMTRLISPQKSEAALDGGSDIKRRVPLLGPHERGATDTTWSDSLRVANQ